MSMRAEQEGRRRRDNNDKKKHTTATTRKTNNLICRQSIGTYRSVPKEGRRNKKNKTKRNLKVKSFGHANSIVILLDDIDSAQSAAGIVGPVVVQDGRVTDQQIQAAVPIHNDARQKAWIKPLFSLGPLSCLCLSLFLLVSILRLLLFCDDLRT